MLADGSPSLTDVLVQTLTLIGTGIAIGVLLWLRASLMPYIAQWVHRQKIDRQTATDNGKMEAINSPVATLNTPGESPDRPILLTARSRQLFAPITADLHRMGQEAAQRSVWDSDRLGYDIQARHRLFLNKVCQELGFHRLGCVAIAEALAREWHKADPNGQVGEVG